MARALDEIRPDVVLTLGWFGARNIAALRWASLHDVAAVIASDSTQHDYARAWWKELVKRKILEVCSAAWAAGTLSAQYLAVLGVPVHKIVKGPIDTIDVSHFSDGAAKARTQAAHLRTRLDLPQEYFFASSRFSPEKNLPTLLNAFSAYRRRAGDAAWHLVLAGDGPLRNEIKRQIDDLDLSGAVKLAGWLGFDALPSYYGLAGAFVHASTRDTWAVVVNEAMAASLPVIVSNRCGCVPDLVYHGDNGFTFDPARPDVLADLMGRVAHGDCDRSAMGCASRDIIEGWTPDRYADSLREVIELALANSRAAPRIFNRVLLNCLGAVVRW
ncbi:MAG TPA: glycosyltransferase [Vicinamibacterales bacterium]|nr:glycosyltransferase [Vicinamibacterales bacterium]